MNEDCLLLILENLQTIDLLAFARTSKYSSILSSYFLRRKFAAKKLLLSTPFNNQTQDLEVIETDVCIKTQHFETIVHILKYFNHSISNLQLNFVPSDLRINGDDDQLSFISSFCADTLTQIDVHDFNHKNIFGDIKTPFKNVKSVSLHGGDLDMNNSALDFAELFPTMERLELLFVSIGTSDKFICKFDCLKHFGTDIERFESDGRTVLKKLLKKNSQIESLMLSHTIRSTLKFVADNLPHLNHLELQNFIELEPNTHEAIHFKQLTSLQITRSRNCPLLNVSIAHLLDFENDCSDPGDLMLFIERNRNLQRVVLNGQCLDNASVLRMTADTFLLLELSIFYANDVECDTIVRLVESKQKLQRLNLQKCTTPNGMVADLCSVDALIERMGRLFGQEWNIVRESESKVVLER